MDTHQAAATLDPADEATTSEPVAQDLPENPKTLVEYFGNRTWNEVFGDGTPLSLTGPEMRWINVPSPEFIRFAMDRKPLSFDALPPDPSLYARPVTFMIAQLHRLWIVMEMMRPYLRPDATVVDLGAYPFGLQVALRDFLKFRGRLIATVNLPLSPEWQKDLADRQIETPFLNLDPLVKASVDDTEYPTRLDLPDGSVDLVVNTNVIEHLYHPVDMLAEAYRVLKPGGRALVFTDNAFILEAFTRVAFNDGYLHEPIEGTGAMNFNAWRGHNRIFSATDLKTMAQSVGLKVFDTQFHEVSYYTFADEYFVNPPQSQPKWRADILERLPQHRNHVSIFCERPA